MSAHFDTLKLTVDSRGVARLALHRPAVRNAMDETMIAELTQVAADLAVDEQIRVVVLTGSVDDSVFCAGGDLRWMQSNMDRPRDEMIAQSATLAQMLKALDELPQLVVGRINGSAFGGGVGLISICDIAIGLTSAKFSLTEVTLGLLPANIAPFVVRRMGPVHARRTFLNAARFDGNQAVDFQLLNEAVSAENLEETVNQEVERALACAPGAIAATKALIRVVDKEPFDSAQHYAARALADAWASDEGQSGVRAFFDKTPAPWRIT